MPTRTIEREPLARTLTDEPDRTAETCACRARALEALGELADLTLALGIHDAEVWRGLGVLNGLLTTRPTTPHLHVLGNIH